MNFEEILREISALLERERRVSYRALRRRFDLDDELLADLREELIEAKRIARDENDRVLVWAGGEDAAAAAASDAAAVQRTLAAAQAPPAVPEVPEVGERKQVTVLFSDVVDSSGLAQAVDPELMHELMERVLRLMADAVHRYGGSVNNYLGDGIKALFGAPVAYEDHALRAVQAALMIQESVGGLNARLDAEHGVRLRVRVGLNSGLVVFAPLAGDKRMDASGNTTHIASRMETLAAPGEVLMTEATWRVVRDHVYCDALGPRELKGQREAISVYRVTGRRRWRSRLEIGAERGLGGFVGRQHELDLLRDRLARAAGGHGQVVGIVGEAGTGKSRLIHEFQRLAGAGEAVWSAGNCLAYGQDTPYLPAIEILRSTFHVEPEDSALQIKDKLHRGLLRLAPALLETEPFLEDLLTAGEAGALPAHLSLAEGRQRTFDAVRAVAMASCQKRVQVVVMENLHWVDPTTQDLLQHLIESLPGMRMLLVTTQRPGYRVPWPDRACYSQVVLDVLQGGDVARLLEDLLGVPPAPALLEMIARKTDGNPLFVEELVRSLRERGLLEPVGGQMSWQGAGGEDIPGTIHDIIQARIDQLGDPAKHTVQTAAVIGREFDHRLLRRVSREGSGVESSLALLKQVDLIHETRFLPDTAFRFKHAVIQDTAYQSLLLRRRQSMHREIGAALEDLYGGREDEQAAVIAYHHALGSEPERAVPFALRAGRRALRQFANSEALRHFAQALAIARACADGTAMREARIDAGLGLAEAGAKRGEVHEHEAILEEAARLAGELGDDRRLSLTLYWQGRLVYARGDMPAALALADRAAALADQIGDEALASAPVNLAGRVAWLRGDYRRAADALVRSADQMQALGTLTEEATAAGFAGWAFACLGDVERARECTERGLRVAGALDNPFARAAAHMYRGAALDQCGDWTGACEHYEQARTIGEAAGDLFRVYLVKCQEGRALHRAGDAARGRRVLEECIALAQTLNTRFVQAWPKSYLAACLLDLDAVSEAETLAREAIALATAAGDRFGAFMGHRALAEALARRPGPAPQAWRAELDTAFDLQREMGLGPELARTLVVKARLLGGAGDAEGAAASLKEAAALFRSLHMPQEEAGVQGPAAARKRARAQRPAGG